MRDGTTKKLYDSMLRRIILGDIPQGEILTDIGLASEFNTSRTPVREACMYLVKEGFLRRALGRGYIVTEISLDDVRELYQLRLMLEPKAAEFAAKSSLPKDFFNTCLKFIEQQRSAHNTDVRSYETFTEGGKAEHGFHCEIAKASGNKRLAKIMDELMSQFRRFHYITFQKSPTLNSAMEEHSEILEAIRRKDPAQAYQLMYRHIQNGSHRAFQLALGSLSSEEAGMGQDLTNAQRAGFAPS
jgi:GntR family transcriptional regulator, rspAB operon transcriptional repressor